MTTSHRATRVGFTVRHYPEHEARCVAAIRERWRQEAQFDIISWWRQRDHRGRFVGRAGR